MTAGVSEPFANEPDPVPVVLTIPMATAALTIAEPERTRQQLDPPGTTAIHPITVALCVGAFLYAVMMTVVGHSEISTPLVSVLGLTLLAAACFVVIVSSRSGHAPLTGRAHGIAHILALGAIVAEVTSQWGSNDYVRDDWGPIALGVILVALAPYRPAAEIASSGTLSAVFIGVLTLAQIRGFVTHAPPIAFVVVAVTPMLAFCYSASMFSNGLVESIERWRKRAAEASTSLVMEFRESIARSIQQDRLTILDGDVLPFFSEVLASERITDADRARAGRIADSIRRVMVEEVDRSWLETVVEHADDGASQHQIVFDPGLLAACMVTDQRTALRALLVALREADGFDESRLRITLFQRGGRCHVRLDAHLEVSDYGMRSVFAPFFAVVRAVFTEVEVDFLRSELTLRFSYEH